jgi:myo-inositol-1(or 4)-monophosphatase
MSTFGYRRKTEIDEREARAYLESAVEFAIAAGKVTLPYFRERLDVDNKGAGGLFDPVTEADRAAEALIRSRIAERYPTHGIVGEEHGESSGSGPTWVIDPIDGTRAFMSGMLHWGVLIAVFDGESPRIGVMYQPFTEELFVGDNSSAEYRRGTLRRALRVRACESLDVAVLASTGPDGFAKAGELDAFNRVSRAVRLTRFGGDCYLYCLLAMGQLDLAVEAGLKPYDIQALMPIIRGAGGIVTTWDGGNPAMGGRVVAAGDRRVHDAARRLLETRE